MSSSNAPRPVLNYAEAAEIVELLRSASAFTEFRMRSGDLEVEVRRGDATAPSAPASAATGAAPAPHPATRPPEVTDSAAAPSRVAGAHSQRAVFVKSPMVGTFYRAPEPGAAPFVQPGQAVTPDTTVCIIEVMKLMNTLPAGCDGVISEILVGDGEAVEYGQVLLVIEPR